MRDETPPPADMDAEAAVLGSMMLEPECIPEVLDVLPDSEAFYRPDHRAIYACITAMHKADALIDIVTIRHHLERRANGRELALPIDETPVETVIRLAQSVPSAANVVYYARIIRECHRRRLLLLTMHDAERHLSGERGEDSLSACYDHVSNALARSMDYGSGIELESLGDIASACLAVEDHAPLPIGLRSLARYEPFQDEYVILGARPSTGKTSLLLQMAVCVAESKRHVLFLSQEMTNAQLVQRLLSRFSAIQMFDLRRGRFSDAQRQQLDEARRTINRFADFLHLAPHIQNVEAMGALVDRTRRAHGDLHLVCLDYLQLCDTSKRYGTRNEMLATISSEVASWRHRGCCVIAASQLNRAQGERNARPTLERLRDSGCLEQDADAVWLLHQDKEYRGPEARQIELIVAKQRNGECGSAWLTFWPEQYWFVDQPER